MAGLGAIVIGIVWLVAWRSDKASKSAYTRAYVLRGAPVFGPIVVLLGLWLAVTNVS